MVEILYKQPPGETSGSWAALLEDKACNNSHFFLLSFSLSKYNSIGLVDTTPEIDYHWLSLQNGGASNAKFLRL